MLFVTVCQLMLDSSKDENSKPKYEERLLFRIRSCKFQSTVFLKDVLPMNCVKHVLWHVTELFPYPIRILTQWQKRSKSECK